MVEGTALEMRRTCKGTVGSNPTLSAININNINSLDKIFLVYPQSYPHGPFGDVGNDSWAELFLISVRLMLGACHHALLQVTPGPSRWRAARQLGHLEAVPPQRELQRPAAEAVLRVATGPKHDGG